MRCRFAEWKCAAAATWPLRGDFLGKWLAAAAPAPASGGSGATGRPSSQAWAEVKS